MSPEDITEWAPVGLFALIVYAVVAPSFGQHVDPAVIAGLFALFGGSKAAAAWQQKQKIESRNIVTVKPSKSSGGSKSHRPKPLKPSDSEPPEQSS